MRAALGGGRWTPVALASALALAALLVLGGGGPWPAAARQDGTPVIPPPTGLGATETPVPPPVAPEPTAAATAAPGAAPAPAPVSDPGAELDPTAPHAQVVAHGLVALEVPVIWRVRELAPAPPESAASVAGGFSFTLQRAGVSIIRNDVTSKRARLEPGEAYFASADDPYTRWSEGPTPAVAWVIELVPADAPAVDPVRDGTVVFAGSGPYTFPSGIFDAELTRGVLLPNEQAALPPHTGPALLMVALGRVETDDGTNPPIALGLGTGQVVEGPLTVRNPNPEPAVYVVAAIGDAVEASAPAPAAAPGATAPADPAAQATAAPAAEPPAGTAAPVEPPAAVPTEGDTDGDGLSDEDEVAIGSDPLNADYDADGLLDGREVNELGTDPLNHDTDGDTILDGPEVDQYGTSPFSADTDGDGAPDADEISIYGTDPLDPASGP
jgi:hypothetical protein